MIILASVFAFFLLLENFYPLRTPTQLKSNRYLENLFLILFSFPFTRLLSLPLVYKVVMIVEQNHWGILNYLKLDGVTGSILSIVLLDYSIYWWHVGNHKLRFLWRFHQVHHSDKDMDSTTALRFHVGELILSSFVRCLFAIAIGFSLKSVILFDLLVTSLTIFHHSNLRLPHWLDQALSTIIVTPLFHQNHHSYFLNETNSNYSTIFSWWDRLHRSFTKAHDPSQVSIGLPALAEVRLTFLKLLKMPVEKSIAWPVKLLKRP